MPGFNLTKLEQRFRVLDARQERLADKTKHFNSGFAALTKRKTDPDVEEADRPAPFTAQDYVEPQPRTLRTAETITESEKTVRASMHHDIAHHVANVKANVQLFLTQQELLRSLPSGPDDRELRRPRAANAEERLNLPGDEAAAPFSELFLDEQTFEARQQLLAVSKLVGSSQQVAEKRFGVSPLPGGSPSGSPKRPSSRGLGAGGGAASRSDNTPHSGSPVPHASSSASGGSATVAVASPYVNPNRMRAPRLGSAKPRPPRPDDPIQPQFDGDRFARTFFNQLPPVVPSRNQSASMNRPRAARPTSSLGPQPRPTTAPSGPRPLVPPKEVVDVVYSKAFYHLHVRVLHSASRLADWEFAVSISDVTHPDRILRHTFKNLRVNDSMYIVFHPPSGIVLSPCDDIPWVASPQSLYRHTFRIEAVATHPTRTKVVDTLVYFGDQAPDALQQHVAAK